MEPEAIGAAVAFALAVLGGVLKWRHARNPVPPAEAYEAPAIVPGVDTTGRHRTMVADQRRASLEILELVADIHRQNAEHARDHARDAVSRQTVAHVDETVSAIYDRVQRLATRDDLRDALHQLRAALETRGKP
jgi:hypothetical protein